MLSKADEIRQIYNQHPKDSNRGLQEKLAQRGIKVSSGQIIGIIGRQADRHMNSGGHTELLELADSFIGCAGGFDRALTYLKISRLCPTQTNRTA